jgi:hypothetical protein
MAYAAEGEGRVEVSKEGHTVSLDGAVWRRSGQGGAGSAGQVEVAFLDGGYVALRDSRDPTGPVLVFTPAEWDAFVAGAKDGEFDLA